MTQRLRRMWMTIATGIALAMPVAAHATTATAANDAISTFNAWCFKAGLTADRMRANMEQATTAPLPFALTFWDVSLEPVDFKPPLGVERRCEVAFDGDHTDKAIDALRVQMATPPIFGSQTELPETHTPLPETALIEGRALPRNRVAIVHVGLRDGQTFMAVDRLFTNWKERVQP